MGTVYLLDRAKVADLQTSQKRDLAAIGPFDYEYSYEQGFVSRIKDLQSIEFPIASFWYPKAYTFYISMYLLDGDGREIASQQYPISRLIQINTIRLSFEPQADSWNKRYRLLIQTDAPPHVVSLLGSEYDSYMGGELISEKDGRQSRDLAFFTYGRPTFLSILPKMTQNTGGRLVNMLLITIVFWGLGNAVTFFLLPNQGLIERITGALLTGISLTPVLFFVLGLLKIRLTEVSIPLVLVTVIFSTALAGWSIWKNAAMPAQKGVRLQEVAVLGALLVVALVTRLVQIQDLMVPNGPDSPFHANAIERIKAEGTVAPESVYHLGFHANAAFISEVTGAATPESMLLYGQWLSIVSSLGFYLLAGKCFGNWKYAVAALCFYWFISPMPAYLMNIGRYPFLQGLVLLPWAAWLIWNNAKDQSPNALTMFLAMAGLVLSHYGAMAILLVVVTAIFIVNLTSGEIRISRTTHTAKFLAVSTLVILMVLIKIRFVITQGTWDSFLASKSIILGFGDYKDIFQHTLRHGGVLLWLLGFLGAILFFAREPKKVPVLFLCAAGLVGVDWIQLQLFGHSATRLTNTLFALAIPLSLFSGFSMQHFFADRDVPAVACIFVLAIAGAYNIVGIVNPANVFYSRADQEAMHWIKMNVSEDSVILINSYPWGDYYSPADGGFWIPYMTGRQTVFPNEHEEYDQIRKFVEQTEADYVYIGSGYGNITPLLMEELGDELVYSANGIYMYEIQHIED